MMAEKYAFRRLQFDPVIHLGHVLTIISFFVVAIGGWFAMRSDISRIDYRVLTVEKSISKMTDVVQILADKSIVDARQSDKIDEIVATANKEDERVNRVDQRLGKLEEYSKETRIRLRAVEETLKDLRTQSSPQKPPN